MSLRSAVRHDESLPLKQRRVQGAYYTPGAVVRYIVGETLISDLWQADSPTVLDPACGDGAFLCEVADRLVERFGSDAVPIAQCSLFGIDCDPEAVTDARRNVARLLGETASDSRSAQLAAKLQKNFIVADALLDPLPPKWPREFDAIVGNPPYVNIRRLAHDSQRVARYRERFRCAQRGFDLYVLFIERAIELLRSGGRCGLIVPNKLATLDYAAACRQLLMEQTGLETVADLSDCRVFSQASVYPQVIVFQKGAPRRAHSVRLERAHTADADTVAISPVASISQWQLNRRGVFDWQESFDVEARIPTRALGELCRLHSGTTGFVAQQLAAALRERSDCDRAPFPFITSGNIDRYAISLGKVRYMKRDFLDPVVPHDCPLLSPAKRRLFAGPKIVIAGMSQRLEAAYHPGPLALGVQVFAAADWQVDPYYLLALLNSRLLSHLFRTRFAAKRLSGGYLSINKGQLAQLPVVDPRQSAEKERRMCARIAELGKRLAGHGSDAGAEAEADRLLEQLYAINGSERASLDAAFGPQSPASVAA